MDNNKTSWFIQFKWLNASPAAALQQPRTPVKIRAVITGSPTQRPVHSHAPQARQTQSPGPELGPGEGYTTLSPPPKHPLWTECGVCEPEMGPVSKVTLHLSTSPTVNLLYFQANPPHTWTQSYWFPIEERVPGFIKASVCPLLFRQLIK